MSDCTTYHTKTGMQISSFQSNTRGSPTLSPSGKLLALIDYCNNLTLTDIQTQVTVRCWEVATSCMALDFRDDNLLAYTLLGKDGSLPQPCIYNVETRERVRCLVGASFAISQDSQYLACLMYRPGAHDGTIPLSVVNISSWSTPLLLPHNTDGNRWLMFSPNSSMIAVQCVAQSSTLKRNEIWNIAKAKKICSMSGGLFPLAWSPDSSYLAYWQPATSSHSENIHIYDVATGKCVSSIQVHNLQPGVTVTWAPTQSCIFVLQQVGLTVFSFAPQHVRSSRSTVR